MAGVNLRFVCVLERHICAVDSDALEQILSQLLSNSLKFTPAGGTITVELRLMKKRVLLSVEDTGCGIAEEQLTKLFDRFLHNNPPRTPLSRPGAGVGSMSAAGGTPRRHGDGCFPSGPWKSLYTFFTGPANRKRCL